MSVGTLAAQIESPAVPLTPTPIVANAGSGLKSPMPDLISDKAYAASLAREARIVTSLLAQPSADRLATAALLSQRPTDDTTGPKSPLVLIRRATLLDPTRPELAWLAAGRIRT